MKKKIKIGGFKVKISWKLPRFLQSIRSLFVTPGYTLNPSKPISPEKLRQQKIYRLFKEKYCEFKHANYYGEHGTRPSSYIYYKGCNELNCKACLIGELMFGEDKVDFFLRKGVFIKEDIHNYTIYQGDETLAIFDKDWVESQGQYQ